MGAIYLACIAANGTRLVGFSYVSKMPFNDEGPPDHMIIVESNPNPTSASDVSWTLLAVKPYQYSPWDFSPMQCNVDPKTGVFTLMSYFNSTESVYNVTSVPNPQQPLPGGIQYHPSSNTWTKFTLSPEYHWQDDGDTFTLFQWPNTTVLFQANIGVGTSQNMVNIGYLPDDGSNEFVNSESWGLDPLVYGYPVKVVFGKDALYQFGTFVANNKTGALNTMLTRIPVDGTYGFRPENKTVINATTISICDTSSLSAKFFNDTLYIFCHTDAWDPFEVSLFYFRDGPIQDKAVSEPVVLVGSELFTTMIQPIGGENGQIPFAYAPSIINVIGITLRPGTLGTFEQMDISVNITDPFGYNDHGPAKKKTGAIIGGTIAGVLLLMVLLLYRPVKRRWPRWKAKLRQKIIAMVSEGQEEDTRQYPLQDLDKDAAKIEAQDADETIEDHGKILVTSEADLEGAVNLTGAIGTDGSFLTEVGLEHHPRPAVVTSFSGGYQGDSDSTISGDGPGPSISSATSDVDQGVPLISVTRLTSASMDPVIVTSQDRRSPSSPQVISTTDSELAGNMSTSAPRPTLALTLQETGNSSSASSASYTYTRAHDTHSLPLTQQPNMDSYYHQHPQYLSPAPPLPMPTPLTTADSVPTEKISRDSSSTKREDRLATYLEDDAFREGEVDEELPRYRRRLDSLSASPFQTPSAPPAIPLMPSLPLLTEPSAPPLDDLRTNRTEYEPESEVQESFSQSDPNTLLESGQDPSESPEGHSPQGDGDETAHLEEATSDRASVISTSGQSLSEPGSSESTPSQKEQR